MCTMMLVPERCDQPTMTLCRVAENLLTAPGSVCWNSIDASMWAEPTISLAGSPDAIGFLMVAFALPRSIVAAMMSTISSCKMINRGTEK